MFIKNFILINSIVVIILLTTYIKDTNCSSSTNYTISGENVILKSYIGDIRIPMPDNVKAELRRRESKLANRRKSRQIHFNPYIRYDINAFPEFFECTEQAQIAISAYGENHRYWEAFFKRNSINNTLSVRYCCNLLEYVYNAELTLSAECRDQIRLQDHVMIRPEIRYVCRQYEFDNVQCFLVRWMYWWIPLVLVALIFAGVFFGCARIKNRRNKSQLIEKEEAKFNDQNSNTLPYRPPFTSPLKSSTNKAFLPQ